MFLQISDQQYPIQDTQEGQDTFHHILPAMIRIIKVKMYSIQLSKPMGEIVFKTFGLQQVIYNYILKYFSISFTVLLGISCFNAIKSESNTIICILYGLGGVAISNAIHIDTKHCKVYFIICLVLFIFFNLQNKLIDISQL